jgi:hypothetical protein
MTLKALCVTLGLFGWLNGNAIALPLNEGDERSNIKTEEAIELFVTCETSFPLLSVRWNDRDNAKAAKTVSTFLNVPSITPQVIIDRAAECFSTLKSERGMSIVHFDNVQEALSRSKSCTGSLTVAGCPSPASGAARALKICSASLSSFFRSGVGSLRQALLSSALARRCHAHTQAGSEAGRKPANEVRAFDRGLRSRRE